MFRNDDPTAASIMPAVAPAGTPGFWTVGNPAIGQPATKITQDWLNIAQEELIAILTMAGVTPNKANLTQIVQSLLAIAVLQDVGTAANSLVVNTRVAISGLTTGTRLCIMPGYTNTGPSTLNFSGNGAVPVVRVDGTPLQPGDLVAGQPADLIYWGGSWVLLLVARRTLLHAPLNLYVSTSGSDSNNGLTAATAFATLQHAWNVIQTNYDLYNYVVTVNIAAGSYAGCVARGWCTGQTSRNSIVFSGAGATTIIVGTNADAVQVNDNAALILQNLQLQASGTGVQAGNGLEAFNGANVGFSGITFGSCSQSHIYVHGPQPAAVVATGNYSIAGAAPTHIAASLLGIFNCNVNNTVTLTGTLNFSSAFVTCADSSLISAAAMSFTGGTVSGSRYSVDGTSRIETNGGGASFFPGSTAGSATNTWNYT